MNMTIVTVILITILCAVVQLTGQNLKRNSMQALRDLASEIGRAHV